MEQKSLLNKTFNKRFGKPFASTNAIAATSMEGYEAMESKADSSKAKQKARATKGLDSAGPKKMLDSQLPTPSQQNASSLPPQDSSKDPSNTPSAPSVHSHASSPPISIMPTKPSLSAPNAGAIESKTPPRLKVDSKNMQRDYGFFGKTIGELERLASLSVLDSNDLQRGVGLACVAAGDEPFFKIYVGQTLYLACAYNHILDERSFAKMQAPLIHFTQCAEMQALQPDSVRVCLPRSNSFDYRVRSNGVDTRLFYEHPLKICPSCVIILCRILSKKKGRKILPSALKEDEILAALCKNTLKNLVL